VIVPTEQPTSFARSLEDFQHAPSRPTVLTKCAYNANANGGRPAWKTMFGIIVKNSRDSFSLLKKCPVYDFGGKSRQRRPIGENFPRADTDLAI
jgi:hypothetical protein